MPVVQTWIVKIYHNNHIKICHERGYFKTFAALSIDLEACYLDVKSKEFIK